ncbi:MAG: coenzyme F420-0:L-glutamate ligase [Candidatus Pacebacteria bacterium]|nr:coenzyme F420-0:L-glutamate ligase [Candidatus Paceibacterota bacterium]MBP9840043.1 coenzyme F420-0:L-glutamate ligase [Candidatus Paceibacterota bacterium]
MQVRAIKTRVFKEGESLADFVASHLKRVPEGSVLVITSKIVALAEGRTAVASTAAKKATLIRSESVSAIKTKWVWLTIKDGLVMPNAGIDESNADGKIILLPADSFKAAAAIRRALMKRFKVKKFGVLITDSRVLPLRAGVTGVALGYAGFKGLRDYRGKKDIFDRPLRMTQTNVADGLAASAVFLMGEGAEQQPLALVTDAPVAFSDLVKKEELMIALKDDLYRPLFRKAGL